MKPLPYVPSDSLYIQPDYDNAVFTSMSSLRKYVDADGSIWLTRLSARLLRPYRSHSTPWVPDPGRQKDIWDELPWADRTERGRRK